MLHTAFTITITPGRDAGTLIDQLRAAGYGCAMELGPTPSAAWTGRWITRASEADLRRVAGWGSSLLGDIATVGDEPRIADGAGDVVDMTDEERAALERLRAAGGGDPVGVALPDDDSYTVVLFGWGPDDEIPYGRVAISLSGHRYMPIDHGTALVRR